MRSLTTGLLAGAVVALLAGTSHAGLVLHSTMDDVHVHRGATYPPPALDAGDGNFTVDDIVGGNHGTASADGDDHTPPNNHDVLESSAVGAIGEALLMRHDDPIRRRVNYGGVPELDDDGSFAFSIWYKPTTLPDSGDYVVTRGERWSTNTEMWTVKGTDPTGEISVRASTDGAGNRMELVHSITEDEWYNIVGVFDAAAVAGPEPTGRLIAYINGEGSGLDGTGGSWTLGAEGNSYASTEEFDRNYNIKMGMRPREHQNNEAHGDYDDFALWDDALTVGEARSLYTLAMKVGLNYNASQAQALWDVFTSGTSATVGGKEWAQASGLSGNAGDVFDLGGGDFALVLDASGNGVSTVAEPSTVIPEPSTFVIWSLGLIGLAAYARWRRTK